MRKFIQQKLKEQKGLTLIELLAVIVILAIIAAIAIPAIGNIIENSRVGAIKSDALNSLAAAELYYTENAEAPDDVALSTLEGDYLDDLGSFASGTVTKDGRISGTGKVGAVSLTFATANKAGINSVKNNEENGTVTIPSGSVVISGR